MSEKFVKPKRVTVPISNIQDMFANGLIKDLQDDEMLCPVCHGSGVIRSKNVYGLSDDPNKRTGVFPYKHEALQNCPNCYNGVVKMCPYCGKALPKGTLPNSCDCADGKRARNLVYETRAKEIFEKAVKHNPGDEYVQKMAMFTDDNEHCYPSVEEMMEFLDAHYDPETQETRPGYIWCTTEHKLKMRADDIVYGIVAESGDFYDDAWGDVSASSIQLLQDSMDEFCEINPCTTYYTDYAHAVVLDWETWDKRYEA